MANPGLKVEIPDADAARSKLNTSPHKVRTFVAATSCQNAHVIFPLFPYQFSPLCLRSRKAPAGSKTPRWTAFAPRPFSAWTKTSTLASRCCTSLLPCPTLTSNLKLCFLSSLKKMNLGRTQCERNGYQEGLSEALPSLPSGKSLKYM